MKPNPTPADPLDALLDEAACHVECTEDPFKGMCEFCSGDWPCRETIWAAALRREREEAAHLAATQCEDKRLGEGGHSYCAIVSDLRRQLAEARAGLERASSALRKIARWHHEFPEVEDNDTGKFVSYGYAYGSNGERDFMRQVAREALTSLNPAAKGDSDG